MTKIQLPVVGREILDNSILRTFGRCPRLAFYRYVLNRAPRDRNYSTSFGAAYHKYREYLERIYQSVVSKEGDNWKKSAHKIHALALNVALKDWVDPPAEHHKSFLDRGRLQQTCEAAFEVWYQEKLRGIIQVLSVPEVAFDLTLPSGHRYGGRIDQIILWNNKLWVRDFKTTTWLPRKGSNVKAALRDLYEPDHSFTGYVWAAQALSGRPVEGVFLEIVYNTQNHGPEIIQTLSTRTEFHINQFLEWAEFECSNWQKAMSEGKFVMRTSACNDYGGCYFRDACRLSSWNQIEQWLSENTVEENWDFTKSGDEL